jgi:hypothetical protein
VRWGIPCAQRARCGAAQAWECPTLFQDDVVLRDGLVGVERSVAVDFKLCAQCCELVACLIAFPQGFLKLSA